MGRPAQKGAYAAQGRGSALPDCLGFVPQMIRMSTGHMEGTLQLLYVLLTDCYVYLLRKGACRPLSPSPESLRCLASGDAKAPHGGLPAVRGPPLHEHPCQSPFQISGPRVSCREGPGPRKWFRRRGKRPLREISVGVSSLRGH